MNSNNQTQNSNHSQNVESGTEDFVASGGQGGGDQDSKPELESNKNISSENSQTSEEGAVPGKEFVGQSEQLYQKFSEMISRFYNLIFKQWRIKEQRNTNIAKKKIEKQCGITDDSTDSIDKSKDI